jgi:hypothetical protein
LITINEADFWLLREDVAPEVTLRFEHPSRAVVPGVPPPDTGPRHGTEVKAAPPGRIERPLEFRNAEATMGSLATRVVTDLAAAVCVAFDRSRRHASQP